VALDPPAVGLKQDIRADGGLLPRDAEAGKGIRQKIVHQIPCDIRSCLCHFSITPFLYNIPEAVIPEVLHLSVCVMRAIACAAHPAGEL
jgi:hypothetical protein